ncbi:TRAP transporter small permease [Alcaligenaceae bacterium]|nr:TRAP transporter small permease [Alcaligenaceae bacterium]
MNIFFRAIDRLTVIFQWAGAIILAVMMLLITAAVIARLMGTAIPGEIELIELTMGTVVMLGLAYTEKLQNHISVGLLVDHWSPRWQAAADLLAVALIFCTCAIIGWVTLKVGVEYLTSYPLSTDYLSVPLWPFKLIVGFGFWLWGLQALLRIPAIFENVREGRGSAVSGGHA